MLAMIFPGQGAQKPGMGSELFDLAAAGRSDPVSMLRAGVTSFAETGPGNVLSRLVSQIRAASPAPAH
jgi:malonyl CoA-acyl carrier protein transacylase